MRSFSRARVPAITTKQWQRAVELVASKGAVLEPAQLRGATGMKLSAACSLILGFFEEHHADIFLLVFHCEAHPVTRRRYEDGFQPVPWMCPDCEQEIKTPDELRYELQAILRAPVRLV